MRMVDKESIWIVIHCCTSLVIVISISPNTPNRLGGSGGVVVGVGDVTRNQHLVIEEALKYSRLTPMTTEHLSV